MATIIKSVNLWCHEGKHDKVYNMQIIVNDKGLHDLRYEYGRRGTMLKSGFKVTDSDLGSVTSLWDDVLTEKLAKTYKVIGASEKETPSLTTAAATMAPKTIYDREYLPQLLNPIEETEVERYIKDPAYGAQEKKDGKHITIHRKNGIAVVTNKKGELIEGFSIKLLSHLPDEIDDVVIDGEAIGDTFWAFDMLKVFGEDLRSNAYGYRLATLETHCPQMKIVPLAVTEEEKRKLYEDLKKAKKEGITFKKLDAPHSAGRPNSGGDMFKCKFYAEASVVVSRVNAKRSVGMKVLDINKTGSDLWVEIGNVTIPQNKAVPNEGDVIEVRYLYAYPGGSLYQPTYKEIRDDVDLSDCLTSQLKFKSAEEE